MRFTVEIADPLYLQAMEVAKERNMTVNEQIIEFVDRLLKTPTHAKKRMESPPISGIKDPMMGALTNQEIAVILGDH